jgi:hypothetical protein
MSASETETWRDLLTPEELASFDAGKYQPQDSQSVSRQRKEVDYNPFARLFSGAGPLLCRFQRPRCPEMG